MLLSVDKVCVSYCPIWILTHLKLAISSMLLSWTCSNLKSNARRSDTLFARFAHQNIITLSPFVVWRSVGTQHMPKSYVHLTWNRYFTNYHTICPLLMCAARLLKNVLIWWISLFPERRKQLKNAAKRDLDLVKDKSGQKYCGLKCSFKVGLNKMNIHLKKALIRDYPLLGAGDFLFICNLIYH